jgi:ribonuclease III
MKQVLDTTKLANDLDYIFIKPELLQEALTHRSASSKNNERLEFLGDSILNFVVAGELFERYPNLPEGDLSRIRASLVNKEGLALVASDLSLGDFLTLGSGELKSGGYRRDSILADAVEAIFGAVYLDTGFNACRDLILRLYQNQFTNIPDPALLKDPKTRLQELLQSRKLDLPNYDVISVSGKAHNQMFNVECQITELGITAEGKASNRRKAEQLAAEKVIAEVEFSFKSNKNPNTK